MTIIKYERGLAQGRIKSAMFKLDDNKALTVRASNVYSEDDPELAISQLLRLSIKDLEFGIDEMSIELEVADGTDLIRVIQRLLRQISSFVPQVVEPDDDDDNGDSDSGNTSGGGGA